MFQGWRVAVCRRVIGAKPGTRRCIEVECPFNVARQIGLTCRRRNRAQVTAGRPGKLVAADARSPRAEGESAAAATSWIPQSCSHRIWRSSGLQPAKVGSQVMHSAVGSASARRAFAGARSDQVEGRPQLASGACLALLKTRWSVVFEGYVAQPSSGVQNGIDGTVVRAIPARSGSSPQVGGGLEAVQGRSQRVAGDGRPNG